jgi:anti-sigma factor RsiW
MDCKLAITLLEPYMDGELDRANAREVETHIDGCADCHAALTRLDELRRALRGREIRHSAPPELRERIAAAAATTATAAARRSPSWLRYAAACMLAFGAGGVSMHIWNSTQTTNGAQTQRDLFASHWRALAAVSPVDVVSSDRHTVKPWFAGKVAQAPVVQDFVEEGFALAGGRIDYVGSERVPVLVYRHGQHLIDVFVLSSAQSAIGTAQREGYALESIALGGQTAVIISDMDATEMTRFRHLLSTPK